MPILAAEPVENGRSYAAAQEPRTEQIHSSRRFAEQDAQTFTLTQRHFVVGGQTLVLDENPSIAVYPGRMEFEVVGWDIRLPYGKQGDIGREMIRQFLTLHGKAERSELTEQEEAHWARISKDVDYRRFTNDRAPAHYVTGTLVDRHDDSCRVEWHDGAHEQIRGKVALAFRILEPGERFTAFAKFGAGNSLQEIQSLSPRSPIANDGERMWREWPANR